MRRHRVVMVLAGVAAVWCAAPLAVTAASAAWAVARAGTWGTAIEVPGLGSLNQGGQAQLTSVSCGAARNCAAGGFYTDGSGRRQAFLVNERQGTWRTVIKVPGLGILNAGGFAAVASVSCPTAGSCAAVGSYQDGSGLVQAFVVSKANSTWGTAIEVPGLGTLNVHGALGPLSVSCASAGNCAAAGSYLDGSNFSHVFVVSETNGTWGTAIKMPGLNTLNMHKATVFSVSCASAGNCAAGGFYIDGSDHEQAFVASETNGTWRKAIEVPGTSTLNAGGNATVHSVSCATAGNCAAVGRYNDGSGVQAFLVSETNGTWGNAIKVPGLAMVNLGGYADAFSVSCATAGNCAAGGTYTNASGNQQEFVISETNGTWGTLERVPGTVNEPVGGNTAVLSVSCPTAGNCGAAGSYATDGSGHTQAFVVNETNGTWGAGIEVPGSETLNAGAVASVGSVSCATAGNCAAGGTYTDGSGHAQAFVVNQA
jgi:hypothetical protein